MLSCFGNSRHFHWKSGSNLYLKLLTSLFSAATHTHPWKDKTCLDSDTSVTHEEEGGEGEGKDDTISSSRRFNQCFDCETYYVILISARDLPGTFLHFLTSEQNL